MVGDGQGGPGDGVVILGFGNSNGIGPIDPTIAIFPAFAAPISVTEDFCFVFLDETETAAELFKSICFCDPPPPLHFFLSSSC